MKGHFVALAIVLLCLGAPHSDAAEAKRLGPESTSTDFIEALKPMPKERGIRVLNAEPAANAPAPSVAVDIKFGLNSAALTDEAKDVIKQMATAMQSEQLSHYRFRLEGHTDITGRPEHNLVLSRQRARAVRDYLIQTYSIAPGRLSAVGRGQEMLLDPGHPDSPVNRRVQVVNLGR
jgi:outer membrane protein OmpA-like peptidoglycan-associated protein